jgi:hypothetical protein
VVRRELFLGFGAFHGKNIQISIGFLARSPAYDFQNAVSTRFDASYRDFFRNSRKTDSPKTPPKSPLSTIPRNPAKKTADRSSKRPVEQMV